MKRPVQLLANHLKNKKLTIAFAESMTCGLLAHKLGSVSDTSEILTGSIVCYSEEVKIKLLKVNQSLIREHSAESQEVTDALANNLTKLVNADIHAAITGLAAQGRSENKAKPVGTVFYSFVFKNKLYKLKKLFRGSPLEIKNKACDNFFKFIYQELKKSES